MLLARMDGGKSLKRLYKKLCIRRINRKQRRNQGGKKTNNFGGGFFFFFFKEFVCQSLSGVMDFHVSY